MKSMLCAASGTTHWIDGRSYRPGPSKQQLCSARAIHYFLLRSWHQVGFDLTGVNSLGYARTIMSTNVEVIALLHAATAFTAFARILTFQFG
jgi:hypothetical protein